MSSTQKLVKSERPENPTANSHTTSMAVWNVPTPMLPGEVRIKIGVSCSAACSLAGGRVEVRDSGGRRIAGGRLGDTPFSGTRALFWTEARFKAPRSEGLHEWTARFLHSSGRPLHQDASYTFTSMRAKPGLQELTVKVLDGLTKAPIKSAYVRLGPSTVFTGDDGVAKVRSSGERSAFVVWARSHKMRRTTIKVSRDRTVEVELTPSPCKYCPDST